MTSLPANEAERPYALVTISDDEFCVATEVLLYSFLRFNPWFEGDVVVLTDTLGPEGRGRLSRLFPVRFEEPDPRLLTATEELRSRFPALGEIHRRFFSLETFRLARYSRLVYLDSDVACLGDVRELFSRPEPLLASYDGFSLSERLAPLLAEAGLPSATTEHRYGERFTESFSSGVLAVRGELLGNGEYDGLLERVRSYRPVRETIFTDQQVVNLHFRDRFTPLSSRYNYRCVLEPHIKGWEGISLFDARLLHFAGSIKPWNDYPRAELETYLPSINKHIDLWRELYEDLRHRGDPSFQARRIAAHRKLLNDDETRRRQPAVLGRVE